MGDGLQVFPRQFLLCVSALRNPLQCTHTFNRINGVICQKTALYKMFLVSSCLHRASTVSKHFFIIPTDAHNYKITGMLKTIKILIIALTCFGSRRNHHQGAILCLAKTTIMILLCQSSMTLSVSWRHGIDHVIDDKHNRIIIVVLAKHKIAP